MRVVFEPNQADCITGCSGNTVFSITHDRDCFICHFTGLTHVLTSRGQFVFVFLLFGGGGGLASEVFFISPVKTHSAYKTSLIDLFTNVSQIYGCFFPWDPVTSHFINLYLTMLQSTLPKSNSHKSNNRPSRRSFQVLFSLFSMFFTPHKSNFL